MEYPKIKPIRLRGKAYTEFRKDVCARAMSRCDTCHLFAPLQDGKAEFNLYHHGHVSHIRHHSIGGGDTMDNVLWECNRCHDKRNSPRWSKKTDKEINCCDGFKKLFGFHRPDCKKQKGEG